MNNKFGKSVRRSAMALLLGISATAVIAVTSSAAFAGMIGSTIRVEGRGPTLADVPASGDFVVGAGVEIPVGGLSGFSQQAINLADSTITFTFNPSGAAGSFGAFPFNGFVFIDLLNNLPDIYMISVDNSLYPGFNPLGVTFDANNIYVNFAGVFRNPGDTLVLNVAVPEPASLALLGLGLAGLGFSRRKSNS